MSAPDPFRVVLAELEAIDAELAAESLDHDAEAGRDHARQLDQLGEADAAELTLARVDALDRAARALRAALAQDRSA